MCGGSVENIVTAVEWERYLTVREICEADFKRSFRRIEKISLAIRSGDKAKMEEHL